ncbi:hypothetical protein BC830DRAFT_1071890 [Chytriomyces sp. MP71]|nr:hypothetical protein BC830DRAFT_1071890 [Chytriomyces sp. MP71]
MAPCKDPKRLAFAICEFLTASIADGTIKADDAEGMEVSIACIGEAFGFDFSDAATAKTLSIQPASLGSIFDVFVATQKRVAEGKAEDRKARAEECKAQGNKLMADKKFKAAVAKYTEAIELDGSNAVYYANRAAAYSQDEDYANAVEDSKRAIEVDPDYSKAYSRMGHAHFCLGNYQDAVESYETGLRLDPGNTAMKQSLASAKAKLGEVAPAASPSSNKKGAAANPFAAMGGGAGGMPDIASLMNNPAMRDMGEAQNMMKDPSALAGMMNNPALAGMMNDPSIAGMMNDPSVLGALGGGAAGSGAGGEEKKKKKKK